MRNGLEVIGVKYTVELLPLKVAWRFRCFPTTFTGKKFANRVPVHNGTRYSKELDFGLQKPTGPSSGVVAYLVLVSPGLDCPGVSLAEVCATCDV